MRSAEIAPRAARLAAFQRLHAEGRRVVLTGTHQVECAPANGGPRWAVGATLRPDPRAAQAIEHVARAAAAVVGANHWLAGAARSSHLSLRRHLEQRRRPIPAGDPLVARYAAALHAAAKSACPVRFAITGLILTPVSVMARAVPADAAADDLAAKFDTALNAQGCHEAGSTPVLWYVNLVYFTGPVHAADDLAGWTEARQQMRVIDVRVTEMQIVRWQYTAAGMTPVALASASLLCDSAARLLRPSLTVVATVRESPPKTPRLAPPLGLGPRSPGGCVVGGVQVGNLSGRYRVLVAGSEVHRRHPAGVAVGQQVLAGRVHGDGQLAREAAARVQVAEHPDPLASGGAVLTEHHCAAARGRLRFHVRL